MNFSSLSSYVIATSIVLALGIFSKKTNTTKVTSTNPTPEETTLRDEDFCASHHLLEAALQQNESLKNRQDQLEEEWVNHVNTQLDNLTVMPPNVTLPVVFHVIHNNGAENIPDADVIASFDFLNKAFANETPYDPSTGVNTEIQFCIAQEDPNGNPTTGINHVQSTLTNVTLETQDIAMKDVSRWDPNRYINIWIVKEICSNAVGCGVAGYAYFPSSHGNPEDGLVVESKWLGGTSGDASVLAHEMGHYLGLYHTFQNGCGNNDCLINGDRVCDTPPDQSTVAAPCNVDINSCTTDVNLSDPNNPFTTDQNDMFWNYMDYGEWDCYSAFTAGQTDRMNFFINGARVSLLDEELCDNPCVNPMTLLVVQGDTIVDAGTTLTFTNNTIGATSFEWEVNGTPVSTNTNLTYTFSPEGTYQVTLNAFNGDTLCNASLSITVIAFDCEGSAHVSDSNGTDVVGCGDINNPCQTIQYALDNVLCSGDTVFVHSGTYQLPTGTDPLTPIALIPENYSVTFFGVEDNGPVIIDGNNERRGFLYSYYSGSCPGDNPNDGIDVSNSINFAHLRIQNAYVVASICGSTYQARGGGIQIFNSVGSDLTVSIQACVFNNNFLEDNSTLNNNGRSISGAAIYINGLVNNQNAATTNANVSIDSCSFTFNRGHQLDNGGHGGALCLVNCETAILSNSFFCNNEVYSENSDEGDLNFDRNAGGALLFLDNYSQFPGHQFTVDACTFVGNSATTANGAGFPETSEGGAIFLTSGDALINNTSATLTVGNSHFYDNTIETGIEHIDNNSGTLDLTSINNNTFSDTLSFSLGSDTLLCAGTPLFAPYFPGAGYEWSTGETTSVVQISGPGLYSVTVSLGQCSVMDEIFITVENCNADCENTWFQTLGTPALDEGGLGIIESGDGNFYVKGYQGDNILLTKITPEGEEIWSRTMKLTSEPRERLYDLILDSDGYLVGSGNSGITNSTFESFVFKYDPINDVLLWNSEVNTRLRASTVLEISPTENYRVLGIKWNSPAPGNSEDAYILSIDRNTGSLSGEVNTAFTTGQTDGFLSATTYDNAIYAAGVFDQNSTLSDFRGAVTKLDPLGNVQWSRINLLPLSSTARMYSSGIIVDQDSILATYYGDNNGINFLTDQVYLSKSDINGTVVWAKAYQFPDYSELFSQEIIAVDDGYLLIFYNRVAPIEIGLLKTDKNGTLQWAKRYATSGELSMDIPAAHGQVLVKNDNIYLVGKSTGSGNSSGDILLIKMDLEGNVLSPCPFIFELTANEIPFANPFSTSITLTDYPGPISISTPLASRDSTNLIVAQSCISSCIEICDNGLDDDADGLIDCFDPDCCAFEPCQTYYYNECDLDCFSTATDTLNIDLEIEWESSGPEEWCSYNTPITGDLDGDGIPEIIGKPCPPGNVPASSPYPNLLIIDGQTGTIETVINTPAFYYVMDAPAIADVDKDGFPEIFVQASDHASNANYTGGGPIISGNVARRVLCYEFDGTNYVERWISNVPGGYINEQQSISVSVADFNGDGLPEIHLGNQIFNSLTGELLVQGGASNHNGSKPLGDAPSLSQAYAVAVDALPDDFCANCSGLELVAGGMVFSVKLDPLNSANNEMTVEVALPAASDGWTSIADLDKDGDIDAVVTTYNITTGLVYAWDIQTPTTLFTPYSTPPSPDGFISQVNISDFDGDGFVEIGVASQFKYQVLKPGGGSLNLLWSIDTDDASGSAGSTAFDFNSDGVDEVVYRSETELLVLDGATGTVATSLPCASGTRVEYPVVVDVDADGETEILCSCDGKLKAFGSASTPWTDSRSVWNQRNYFNVNIEDDLTVPAYQQLHQIVGDSIVLNNFLTMYAPDPSPLPDATISINAVTCEIDVFVVTLTICNIGDNTLSFETPITFYNDNPTTTTADTVLTTSLGQNVLMDSCLILSINVPTLFEMPVYIVVNDDFSLLGPYYLATDFPVTAIAECDYTNNLDSFLIDIPEPPTLDLGPDTLICDNGVLDLNAGSGFDSYFWFDGTTDSTLTVFGPGEYWVEVTSFCGTQRDTIEIYTLPVTDINLPPMLVLCNEACTTIEVTDWYDTYEWIPSDYLDCDTCSTVVACPPEETTYIVIGSSALGCFSIDTITLIPVESVFTMLDTAVCLGDVFEFNGMDLPIGTTDTFSIPGQMGCMDTIVVNVSWNGGEDLPVIDVTAAACENESIIFDNVEIPAGDSADFFYQTYLGCDSIIHVNVLALSTYEDNFSETICEGDSILIFGEFQSQASNYTMVFNSADGCDSTVNVTLSLFPTINNDFIMEPTCPGIADGTLTAIASGGGGGFTYLWSNGETTDMITDLDASEYFVTVTDVNGCMQVGSAVVDELQTDLVIMTTDATCFNTLDGSATVINAGVDWMFSLNDGPFQASPDFTGLPAGDYNIKVVDSNGCETSEQFVINSPPEVNISLPVDPVVYFIGDTLDFDDLNILIFPQGAYSYAWSPSTGLSCTNCINPVITDLTETTVYTLTVSSSATCFAVDSFSVVPQVNCDGIYALPNAFTPDADGKNDLFRVLNTGIIDIKSFVIFDRWGEKVYEDEGISAAWNGQYKDKPMPADIYIYIITIVCPDGKEERVLKGDVTLIR